MATKLNVVWETNGCYPAINNQQLDVADGETTVSLTPPITPVRPGFTFINWSIMDTAIETFPYTYTIPTGVDTVHVVGQWNPAVETTGRGIIILGVNPPISDGVSSAQYEALDDRVTEIEDTLGTTGYNVMQVKG